MAFKKGDKFILELGEERKMFNEFQIAGTDLYVKKDLLEKLTPYSSLAINTITTKDIEINDLIRRSEALECFHDWVDQYGDVHTADEMKEYQAIEALPSAQLDFEKDENIPMEYFENGGI